MIVRIKGVMNIKNYYTQTEYKQLLKDICIVCTTNEQSNEHITSYFTNKKIDWESRSLKTGDYCFKLKKNLEVGRFSDLYFTDELFIERKNSLSELASSIKNETFHNELKRSQDIRYKYLIVEQEGGFHDILTHNYRNEYDPKAFFATMHTLMAKYDLKVIFTTKEEIPLQIYSVCKSVLERYVLK